MESVHLQCEHLLQLRQLAAFRLKLDKPCAAVGQTSDAVTHPTVRGAGKLPSLAA